MSSVAPDLALRPVPAAWGSLLLALLLVGMGAYVAGIGLGWLPCDPASVQAPPWIVATCGAVFACGGVGVLAAALGHERSIAPVAGALVLVGLTLMCHWIAFADGERRFTSTTYAGGLEMQRHAVDERTGRTAFAVAAVSLDVLLVLVAARAWRARTRPAGE